MLLPKFLLLHPLPTSCFLTKLLENTHWNTLTFQSGLHIGFYVHMVKLARNLISWHTHERSRRRKWLLYAITKSDISKCIVGWSESWFMFLDPGIHRPEQKFDSSFFLPTLEKFEAKKNRAIILLYFIRGGYWCCLASFCCFKTFKSRDLLVPKYGTRFFSYSLLMHKERETPSFKHSSQADGIIEHWKIP